MTVSSQWGRSTPMRVIRVTLLAYGLDRLLHSPQPLTQRKVEFVNARRDRLPVIEFAELSRLSKLSNTRSLHGRDRPPSTVHI
jgi:hypothetical protein